MPNSIWIALLAAVFLGFVIGFTVQDLVARSYCGPDAAIIHGPGFSRYICVKGQF